MDEKLDLSVARGNILDAMLAIARSLVDYPDQLCIEMQVGEQTTVFKIKCSPMDMGKVLGKQGKNIEAMRVILYNIAAKHRLRAVLELDE